MYNQPTSWKIQGIRIQIWKHADKGVCSCIWCSLKPVSPLGSIAIWHEDSCINHRYKSATDSHSASCCGKLRMNGLSRPLGYSFSVSWLFHEWFCCASWFMCIFVSIVVHFDQFPFFLNKIISDDSALLWSGASVVFNGCSVIRSRSKLFD